MAENHCIITLCDFISETHLSSSIRPSTPRNHENRWIFQSHRHHHRNHQSVRSASSNCLRKSSSYFQVQKSPSEFWCSVTLSAPNTMLLLLLLADDSAARQPSTNHSADHAHCVATPHPSRAASLH